MRIKRFNEMSLEQDIVSCFINHIGYKVLESTEGNGMNFLKKITKDLNLNVRLIATFGATITALQPIISELITNSKLDIEINSEKIMLLTLASICVVMLEDKKNPDENLRKNCRTMLEELKLNGIGNGIVKKCCDVIRCIKSIFTLIAKHSGAIVGNIVDMFGYTALLIPILNGLD